MRVLILKDRNYLKHLKRAHDLRSMMKRNKVTRGESVRRHTGREASK